MRKWYLSTHLLQPADLIIIAFRPYVHIELKYIIYRSCSSPFYSKSRLVCRTIFWILLGSTLILITIPSETLSPLATPNLSNICSTQVFCLLKPTSLIFFSSSNNLLFVREIISVSDSSVHKLCCRFYSCHRQRLLPLLSPVTCHDKLHASTSQLRLSFLSARQTDITDQRCKSVIAKSKFWSTYLVIPKIVFCFYLHTPN